MIPGFFDDLDFSNDEEDLDDDFKNDQDDLDHDDKENSCNFQSLRNILSDSTPVMSPRPQKFLDDFRVPASSSFDEEAITVHNELKHLTSTPAGAKVKTNLHLRSKAKAEFPEGRFFGLGRHRDGEEISNYIEIP